jgi:LysR substrate binding domain
MYIKDLVKLSMFIRRGPTPPVVGSRTFMKTHSVRRSHTVLVSVLALASLVLFGCGIMRSESLPPPPPPEPSRPELQRAYWNTWFQRGDDTFTELKTNSVYSFVLDVAAYDYRELDKRGSSQGVAVAPELQEWLRVHQDLSPLELTVRPVLLGDSLRFFGGAVEHLDITIQPHRLIPRQIGDELAEAYSVGLLPLPKFAKRVQAGSVEFRVETMERGCATIALSIWHGLMPLDHLVRTVAVGDETGFPTNCGGQIDTSGSLRGGAAALLDAALDLGSNPSSPPDAALQIFEVEDDEGIHSVLAAMAQGLTHRQAAERLGLRLLTRTTRSVAPTEAGERLLQTVGPHFDGIEAGLAALSALPEKPAGSLRITSVEHAADAILAPALATLLPDYPDIKVEITTDYGLTDIVAERYDAGVRLGEQLAKDMIAVRIGPDMRMAVVGSPSYFAKTEAANCRRGRPPSAVRGL